MNWAAFLIPAAVLILSTWLAWDMEEPPAWLVLIFSALIVLAIVAAVPGLPLHILEHGRGASPAG